MQINYSNDLIQPQNRIIHTNNLSFIQQQIGDSYSSYIQKSVDAEKDTVLTIPSADTIHIIALQLETEEEKTNELENARRLAAKAMALIGKEKIEVANYCTDLSNDSSTAFIEGLHLANYSFDKYKTEKKDDELKVNIVLLSEELLNSSLELIKVSEANAVARTLVNEPVSFLTATQLSKEIEALSKENGFDFQYLEKKQIESLKMGGLLGVNKGSEEPPTFNILEWKPKNAKNAEPIVLVGKGVVYDTGGYDLKTDGHMNDMKLDMAGAAAVVGTLCAVSKNELPVHVVGLIPATDNRIGPNGLVADDVITMFDGTTVEVKNTDAEGRLILADALAYAKKYNPQLVIDLATLTGAAMRVTGHYGSAMMGNASSEVKQQLIKSGEQVYERLVEFPFWREFDEEIKSDVADIKNLGGPAGGATTAGKFLAHFTDYPWIHLDIAGPSFIGKPFHYYRQGGTGVGVRLLYDYLKNSVK